MKNDKIVVLVAAIVVASIALSGCTEVDEKKIIVGTSADYPPFEYMEGGSIVGFDIELIRSILEEFNYTVEVQDIGFDSLIASLKSGKIDVIAAAMTITDERELQIDFSDPYYESDQSIIIKTNSGIVINITDDLANLTIGAQTGTTGELWVWDNLINITNATMNENQLRLYETYTLAILDLDNGNIDAVILDKPVGLNFAENENRMVAYTNETEESFGFGVKEGNSKLLEEINNGLNDFIGSEEWSVLVNKYFE